MFLGILAKFIFPTQICLTWKIFLFHNKLFVKHWNLDLDIDKAYYRNSTFDLSNEYVKQLGILYPRLNWNFKPVFNGLWWQITNCCLLLQPNPLKQICGETNKTFHALSTYICMFYNYCFAISYVCFQKIYDALP